MYKTDTCAYNIFRSYNLYLYLQYISDNNLIYSFQIILMRIKPLRKMQTCQV